METGEQCQTCGNDYDPQHPCRCAADTFPCSACGKPTHIDALDAKDDGTGNYTILECENCYGSGWVHGAAELMPWEPDAQNRNETSPT